MKSRNPGGKVDLGRELEASNDEFLNEVFHEKLFGEEADTSRHSWSVPRGPWWKGPKVRPKVRITVG